MSFKRGNQKRIKKKTENEVACHLCFINAQSRRMKLLKFGGYEFVTIHLVA